MLMTLQYLEYCPELKLYSKKEVVEKLKYSFDRLPISHLLIGWDIPHPLLEACKKECEKNHTKFVRWQPLLTGDKGVTPIKDWQVTGLSGNKIPGFQNLPEFTFVCPNCKASTDLIFENINQLIDQGIYDGFFLDRIRYPSPASNPLNNLGCFCKSCQQKALASGIHLEELQKSLLHLTESEKGKLELIKYLFGTEEGVSDDPLDESMALWMKFREESVSELVTGISKLLGEKGMDVGLDCFSPSLTRMVGQNLKTISQSANWLKIMSYAHTFGPAGLPFEIIGLFEYLNTSKIMKEEEILGLLSTLLRLPLPGTLHLLKKNGLSPLALENEMRKAIESVRIPILAGLELVEIPDVASLSSDQIIADHKTVSATKVAGLSISWDLWHIPNHRLDLISSIWSA